MAYSLHLVGSIPLQSSEAVFRKVAGRIGPFLKRLPDGETGERSAWTAWQGKVVERTKGVVRSGLRDVHGIAYPTYALEPGVSPDDLDFGNLGYTPNLRARRLRTGRADTIAIFSSMSMAIAGGRARLGFTMEIAAAAAVRALESGIALVLVPTLKNDQSSFRDLHIDGALVVEPIKGDPAIAFLRERGIPLVSIGQCLDEPAIPFVDINPYQVAYSLAEHLYASSRDHVALIVAEQQRHTHLETERAYRDFALAHQMRPIVRRADEAGGEKAGHDAALDLLTKHPEVGALFVSVDTFAVGARRAAFELGRMIPGSLKMATRYDGIYARESDPPLTAVNLHLDELATLGVELLLDHIAGRTNRASQVGPAATLIARASSAQLDRP